MCKEMGTLLSTEHEIDPFEFKLHWTNYKLRMMILIFDWMPNKGIAI